MATEKQDYNSDCLSDASEEEDVWSHNSETSSEGNLSWIAWWCAHQGHEYFAEVPEEFIEDDFNMTGLSSSIALYKESLELILDLEPEDEYEHTAAQQDAIESSAQILYGLIHQRYICSRNGIVAMAEKYEAGHFGVCPRALCDKTAVLPVGQSDVLEEDFVKLYCPTCLDIYNPPNSRFNLIDGAYFGTTFPHLFFMTFPELLPQVARGQLETYVSRIYGFRVSSQAKSGPRMSWLRLHTHHDEKKDFYDEDPLDFQPVAKNSNTAKNLDANPVRMDTTANRTNPQAQGEQDSVGPMQTSTPMQVSQRATKSPVTTSGKKTRIPT